jgi:DNA-binding NarL/FixJ family response regulator
VPVRIVIADDSRLVREGIEQILALDRGLEVAASCASLPELVDAIERETPDVVLTDLRMPPAHDDAGIVVAVRLRETHPEIGVIVVSHYADPLMALKLIETGPDRRGYLLKARLHRAAQVAAAIKAVADGGIVIDPTLVEMLRAGPARSDLASIFSAHGLPEAHDIAERVNAALVLLGGPHGE